MFIDVHCHLDYYRDEETKEIIERAREKRVGIVVSNGTNHKANEKVLELAEKYGEVKCALGLYPIEAIKMSWDEINKELDFIRKNGKRAVAIGEVGIDFKESIMMEEHEKQKKLFDKIVKLSALLNKPIIVHSRKAEKECVEILERNKAKKVIMHCFNGNFNLVSRIKENGWMISIPTNVTFSEHFQKIIKETDLKNLLCETDSPYLHPEKKRNNEPGNVVESYKKIAEIKGMKLKEVEKKIEENYKRVFS